MAENMVDFDAIPNRRMFGGVLIVFASVLLLGGLGFRLFRGGQIRAGGKG